MITTTVVSSATISPTEQVTSEKLNLLGAPTVTVAGTADASQITDGAITAAKLADDAVTNVKVAAAAAIVLSKLEAVTSLSVVAGSSTAVAAPHELLGDVEMNRAASITLTNLATGALAVGDRLQIGSPSIFTGTVVKLGGQVSVGGSLYKNLTHINADLAFRGTTQFNAPFTSKTVYRQPASLVVRVANPTRSFSIGSVLTGQTSAAYATVLTCSAGVFVSGSNYDYTLTLSSVSGFFALSEVLTVDGAAAAFSTSVAPTSGKVNIGDTFMVTGNTCDYTAATTVLASDYVESNPTPYVNATQIKTATADTSGKVLTSTGAFTAPTWQSPVVSSPLVRGGAKPAIPANFIGGNSSSYVGLIHASAWDMQGWQLSGSDYFVYLYNANFNTATINTSNGAVASTGDIAVNDIITFFPKTTAPGVQPFDTEQSVATEATGVASAYAAYKVASVTVRATVGSMTNVREVTLVRASDDIPVTWNTTTYAGIIGSTTVKALCGRQAFSLNGGRLFKCGEVADTGLLRTDPPTTGGTYTGGGSYVLLFNTESVANTYSAHINASGEYIVTSTLGGTTATAYYGGWVTIPYRTTRRLHFNYIPRSTYSYEPREVSILIYEQ